MSYHYLKRFLSLIFVIEIIIIGYLFFFSDHGYARIEDLEKEISLLSDKLTQINQTVYDLKHERALWKEDDFYKEKMARESLSLGYPQEYVIYADKN